MLKPKCSDVPLQTNSQTGNSLDVSTDKNNEAAHKKLYNNNNNDKRKVQQISIFAKRLKKKQMTFSFYLSQSNLIY